MKIVLAGLALILSLVVTCRAQSVGDYRTSSSGNWNNVSIWERFNGTWQSALATPTSSNGTITVQLLHSVTIPTGLTVSADQLVVDGQLVISSGGQLTLANGTGTDLTATSVTSDIDVSGIFLRNNGSTIDNQAVLSRLTFHAGSEYRHGYTTSFGDLPTASWDPASTITIQGFTSLSTLTANATWSQTVGNVTYNAPGQRALIDFAGNLTTIRGNFSVLSTGSSSVQMSSSQSPAIVIGEEISGTGNLTVSGTSRLIFATTGASTSVTIYGDWIHNSANTTGSYLTFTGNTTVELYGDFVMNAGLGRIHMTGAGTTGASTMNLRGGFSVVTGRLDELGSEPSAGNIRFIGTVEQDFVNSGDIAGHVNYYISPTSIVDASIYSFIGASPSAFTLEGTLIAGSLHTLGAIQTATTAGNIRTPNANRTYANGATIIYRGTGQQYMGTGQPQDTGVTTIIDNDVTLAANATINGVLRLASGTLNLYNYKLTSGGTLETVAGTLGGNSLSNLVVQGTTGGDWGTMVFDPAADTLGVLTLDRTGASAAVSLNSSLNIVSQLNLTEGNFNNISGLTMIGGAILTRYNTSNLVGPSPIASNGFYEVVYRTASAAAGPFADFTNGPELPADGNSLGALTINMAQISDVIRLNNNITPNGNINLTRGLLSAESFTITMQGINWVDNTGNFDAGTGTVIFNDSTIVGGTSGTVFLNIGLTASSYLEFTRNYTIQGNIDFATGSTFNTGGFTAILSGSNFQTISAGGNTFSSITVAKSDNQGMILTSSMNLTGLLQFSTPSANVDFNSNGFLTVASNDDSAGGATGTIYRLQSGNTVSGNVTVQRYMSGEGRIYRYISSPVSDAMVSQWKDDFIITGNFLDPSPTQKTCGVQISSSSPSLYYYDETALGTIDVGYTTYPRPGFSTTNSPIVVGLGYATAIRRCDTPTVIDVTGSINQGIISLPLTYTVSDPAADGWNLVGNPYPATIDWDLSGGQGWTKTRISNIISIMDDAGGMMRYYDPGVTEDIPGGLIATGQAFWVRATAAAPGLTIREGVKVTTVGEFFRESIPDIPSFALSLSTGNRYDKAYVKMHAEAKSTLDDFDAPKISNPTFSFSTLSEDNISMAINAYSELSCNTELKVGMNGVKPGNYAINVESRGQFKGYRFILVDHFLNKEVPLNSTSYRFDVTSNKQSSAFDRFSLKIEEPLPNVDIVASVPEAVCGASASISLRSTEKGVSYGLWNAAGKPLTDAIIGNGDAVSISLSADSLTYGANEVIIKATRYCASVPFTTSYKINRESLSPELTDVSSTKQCQPGSVTLSATSNMSSGTFYWYEREAGDDPIYEGAIFITPELKKSKTYYVSAVSDGGCISQRSPVVADVVVFDPAVIQATGGILTSNYSEGNLWYFNGQLMEGSTTSVSTLASGLYELKVTVNGCVTTDSYNFTLEEGYNAWVGIKAYPNPVVDQLVVEVHGEDVQKIEFTTVVGQVFSTIHTTGENRKHFVDLGAMSDGMYLMVVSKKTSKQSYRLLKKSK